MRLLLDDKVGPQPYKEQSDKLGQPSPNVIHSRRFSLIVGTLGRTAELEEFLSSLAAQEYWDFELVIVDQNTDDRLVGIVARWREQFASVSSGLFNESQLVHLRCKPGLSRARNQALLSAVGQLIAFPDDDCWYPPDTLKNVSRWFQENQVYDVLSLTARDKTGVRSGNRWHQTSCDLAPLNIFRASASYTFFVRRSHHPELRFDEDLGIGSGTAFGSGEDTDFVLRALKTSRGRFESKWHIGHPQKDMMGGNMTVERSMTYGLGMGRVLVKHSLLFLWMAFATFDLSRAFYLALRGKKLASSLYLAHGKGILRSYFAH